MNAAWSFRLETDEGLSWVLAIDTDDGMLRMTVSDPEQLLAVVRSHIGPWLEERQAAYEEWRAHRGDPSLEDLADAYSDDWPKLFGLDGTKWAA